MYFIHTFLSVDDDRRRMDYSYKDYLYKADTRANAIT